MTAKIAHLQAELDALQTELNSIDLATLQAAFDTAKSAKAAFKPPSATYAVNPEERELSAVASAAESALTNAKNRARDLNRRAQPLRQLLESPARLEAAKSDLSVLQSRAIEAATVVATAQTTLATLTGAYNTARVEYDQAIASEAKNILSSAAAGQPLARSQTDRAPITALAAAVALAEAELATAETRHAESLSDVAAAQRQLTQATIDAAGLRFELQTRDFVDSVCAFEFNGGTFDPADLSERCLIAQQNAAGLRDMLAEQNAEH